MEISDYAKQRMNSMEYFAFKKLQKMISENEQLSVNFKNKIRVNMSAKYQTFYLSVLNNNELGLFEYNILQVWCEDIGISYDWGDEREDKIHIDLIMR